MGGNVCPGRRRGQRRAPSGVHDRELLDANDERATTSAIVRPFLRALLRLEEEPAKQASAGSSHDRSGGVRVLPQPVSRALGAAAPLAVATVDLSGRRRRRRQRRRLPASSARIPAPSIHEQDVAVACVRALDARRESVLPHRRHVDLGVFHIVGMARTRRYRDLSGARTSSPASRTSRTRIRNAALTGVPRTSVPRRTWRRRLGVPVTITLRLEDDERGVYDERLEDVVSREASCVSPHARRSRSSLSCRRWGVGGYLVVHRSPPRARPYRLTVWMSRSRSRQPDRTVVRFDFRVRRSATGWSSSHRRSPLPPAPGSDVELEVTVDTAKVCRV